MINTNFKINHATKKQINRTSRIGTVHASFEELKKAFGEPHDCTMSGEWEAKDNKTRVEWAFIVNNDKRIIFTIYDFKDKQALDEVKRWSLGGKKRDQKIVKFLEEADITAELE